MSVSRRDMLRGLLGISVLPFIPNAVKAACERAGVEQALTECWLAGGIDEGIEMYVPTGIWVSDGIGPLIFYPYPPDLRYGTPLPARITTMRQRLFPRDANGLMWHFDNYAGSFRPGVDDALDNRDGFSV